MKIFISSTVKDLVDERGKVRSTMSSLGFESFCSEFEGAHWPKVLDTLEKEISDCQIFLGIYGKRYGFVPNIDSATSNNISTLSITEIEFRKAKALNKPMLIYIKNVPDREELQNSFIEEVQDFYKGNFICNFSSAEELSKVTKTDVVKLICNLIKGNYRYPTDILPTIAVFESQKMVCEYVANEIINILKDKIRPTIGLFAGRTAGAVYDTFIERSSSLDLPNIKNALFYMNAEHFGLANGHPNTYQNFLKKHLLKPMSKLLGYSIEKNLIAIPSNINRGTLDSIFLDYDSTIGASRIHLQLLGIAPNGQIASIDPSNNPIHELESQNTQMVDLSTETTHYLFPKPVTNYNITMGIGNILNCSDKIILVVSGENKSLILKRFLLEPISSLIPATLLKKHPNLTIVCDKEAIKDLPYSWLERYPKIVTKDSNN